MNCKLVLKIILYLLGLLGVLTRCDPNKTCTLNSVSSSNADCVFANIAGRKSVRNFTPTTLRKTQIDSLLVAAMAAPSSRNVQPWLFYVIQDQETKTAFAEVLPTKIFPNAPVLIVVCGNKTLKNEEPDQLLNWSLDCAAASQNLLLAAEAMGLGAVWTGVYPYKVRIDAVSSILQLPDHIIPLNIIPVGYPAGTEQAKNKFDSTKIIWYKH